MTLWYRHTDSSLLFNEAQCHKLGTDILYTRSSMIVCDESNISLKNCNVLKSLRTKRHSCECHEGGWPSWWWDGVWTGNGPSASAKEQYLRGGWISPQQRWTRSENKIDKTPENYLNACNVDHLGLRERSKKPKLFIKKTYGEKNDRRDFTLNK